MTSSRRPDSWIVPGGGVEPDEDPAVTALREVREEAGVLGHLGRCLGVFEVHKVVKKLFYYLSLEHYLFIFNYLKHFVLSFEEFIFRNV